MLTWSEIRELLTPREADPLYRDALAFVDRQLAAAKPMEPPLFVDDRAVYGVDRADDPDWPTTVDFQYRGEPFLGWIEFRGDWLARYYSCVDSDDGLPTWKEWSEPVSGPPP